MARIIQRSGLCPNCQCQRLCQKVAPRHGMHATLFVATMGLSVGASTITYAGRAAQKFRCQTCGSKMKEIYTT
jgi:hypothetical protein